MDRWTRRQAKLVKRAARMPMHGRTLGTVYQNAVSKGAKK